jgi:putative flippase GtrA
MEKKTLIQTLKYGIVGVMNTLLTMITIWIMMHFVFKTETDEKISSLALSVSNTAGYIVGLVNSFIWNRSWTFKSQNNWKPEFIRFLGAFLVCFLIQLAFVNILYKYVIASADICQLCGILIYTALNFVLNKYFTFKK